MNNDAQLDQLEVAKKLLAKGCTTAPGLGWRLQGTVRRIVRPDGTVEYFLLTGRDNRQSVRL